MNRRRFLGAAGAGAAALVAGCDYSLSDGVLNACHAGMPPHLRTHALVAAACRAPGRRGRQARAAGAGGCV